jgi:hypothetical protein
MVLTEPQPPPLIQLSGRGWDQSISGCHSTSSTGLCSMSSPMGSTCRRGWRGQQGEMLQQVPARAGEEGRGGGRSHVWRSSALLPACWPDCQLRNTACLWACGDDDDD